MDDTIILRRGNEGFTLIEMLVTVALLLIVSTIAVPGFNQLLQSHRSSSQAHLFFQSVQYARTEAVRRNIAVRLSPHNKGWCVHSNDSCTAESALREFSDTTQLVSTSFSAMAFDGRGRRVIPAGASVTVRFQPKSCSGSSANLVEISALGHPSLRKGACQ